MIHIFLFSTLNVLGMHLAVYSKLQPCLSSLEFAFIVNPPYIPKPLDSHGELLELTKGHLSQWS